MSKSISSPVSLAPRGKMHLTHSDVIREERGQTEADDGVAEVTVKDQDVPKSTVNKRTNARHVAELACDFCSENAVEHSRSG